MRFRVKEGAAYRNKAGEHHEAGAVVEVDEHEAAIVPWCLESAGEDPPPPPPPEPPPPPPPEQAAPEQPPPAVEEATSPPAQRAKGKKSKS